VAISEGDQLRLDPSLDLELAIACEANGLPRPSITWLWNGIPVEDRVDGWHIYQASDKQRDNFVMSKLSADSRQANCLSWPEEFLQNPIRQRDVRGQQCCRFSIGHN
jgi:hypothetical protein